jgi:hypothetical protein
MKPDLVVRFHQIQLFKILFMKFFLSFGVVLLIITSCSTVKWKRRYEINKFLSLQKKYSNDNEFIVSNPNVEDSFETKSVKKIKRKGIKKNIRLLEKGLALVPDSVYRNGVEIDSFYKNQNKIHFILKKKLESGNIFMSKLNDFE